MFSLNQCRNVDDSVATFLRIGLGLVFVIGGISKLSQLLDPEREAAIISSYWGSSGYVNQFFVDYMFGDGGLSEWWFLTSLSFFEAVSGVLLLIGLFIRPVSLIYAFMLWSFVIALPVVTTPGVEVSAKTYMAPALLVQVRDVALSGMMFVLYNLGSGRYSLDSRLFKLPALRPNVDWDNLGLLLRLSIALPLIVGGFFNLMPNIPTFATHAAVLIFAGLVVVGGSGLRYAGIVVAAIMLWYMVYKINVDKSLIANLNGFKREFAFFAGGVVLSMFGGGKLYTIDNGVARFKAWQSSRQRAVSA